MRISVLSVACAALLWSATADATIIVQDLGGSTRYPGTLNFFDPALGELNYVQIEGTMFYSSVTIRNDPFNLSELSVPQTGFASLNLYTSGAQLGSAILSGYESYSEGNLFGGVYAQGSLLSTISGLNASQFIAGDLKSDIVWSMNGPIIPLLGQPLYYPSDGYYYTIRVTYVYNLPELSTWAMMLLGFAAIGFAVRRTKAAEIATA